MTNEQKLFRIKFIHTLIWLGFNVILAYLFYAVLTNQIGYLFWIGIGCIVLECVVLVRNQWTCPLTIVARRYSDSTRENFDIFLPNWLAKYNKLIYSTLFGVLILLYLFRSEVLG